MEVNADFTKRAAMHGAEMEWVPSPMAGVERRMLDRLGDEVARATSIVRYAPNSRFSAHTHDGGEEFLVLEGVFQDEHGDFPAGTYVRNPPTSKHTPGSEDGCVIFVKLWQFDLSDRTPVRIALDGMAPTPVSDQSGIARAPLFRNAVEDVRLEVWRPGANVRLDVPGGMELLVLEGSFVEHREEFSYQSWLRLPAGGFLEARAGGGGCKLWVKSGHLRERPRAPVAA